MSIQNQYETQPDMHNKIMWISIDPIKCKIDEYPKYVSTKIENAYKNNEKTIVLGASFYNATIHFDRQSENNLEFYQTTLNSGISYNRSGYKPPGFRTVKRIILDNSEKYIIHIKYNNSQWHICNINEKTHELYGTANPYNILIENSINLSEDIKSWKPYDIINEYNEYNDDKYVVVWKWCNVTRETYNTCLLQLDDKYWTPYLYEQNKTIEEGFKNDMSDIEITLPVIDVVKNIKVYKNNCNALQVDNLNKTIRHVRRTIMKISDLKKRFDDLKEVKIYEKVVSDIQNEFLCPIGISIMIDPVKTFDNHTYDRINIERWLSSHNTSPLTGLVLENKNLIENKELKKQIDDFIKLQTNCQTNWD